MRKSYLLLARKRFEFVSISPVFCFLICCFISANAQPPSPIVGNTYLCSASATTQLSSGLSSTAISGGTITSAGGYRIHTFTSSDYLLIPTGVSGTGDALVVAGGGGGGTRHAGGGGAGGYLFTAAVPLSGTMATTVGAGGAAGTNGSNSIFASATAIGGGFGSSNGAAANIGGSGGGGSNNLMGMPGTAGQGFAGGNQGCNTGSSSVSGCNILQTGCGATACYGFGAGGGGAGGAGLNAPGAGGSAGGVGVSNSISGVAIFYCGGGGGGRSDVGVAHLGGNGGGGAGGNSSSLPGINGTANTGGGGGGGGANGGANGAGGTGGSGVIIVRYPSPGTWTSSNTSVATVGLSSGLVTAVASGTSTITYTTAGGSVNVIVTVGTPLGAPLFTAANITVGPVSQANGTALLPDANLTTQAAEYSPHHSYRGRLFNLGPGVRGWAPIPTTSYWQVDLGSIKPVNGIITQGRGDYACGGASCNQWVSTYEVQISTDNSTWTSLGIFNGNADETTPVTNMFANMTTNARYVRVYPKTYSSYVVMRIDVISIPSLCASGAQSVSVSAEPNAGGNTIRWYANAVGGSPLATSQFYTASISTSTNFYAASYNSANGCESAGRTMVTAQVNVAVGSSPAGAASLPAICTDFVNALPAGWKTDHQALATPSISTTHDCAGLAASMNTSGHYVWVRYAAAATNVRYSLKLNNNGASAIRYLLVEQSADGCVWSPVTVHTNTSVATDLSIVEFNATLNGASRHVRFNMTRRDVSAGKIEVDNVIVYNTSLPVTSLAPTGSSKTCKVYGNHWVNFYTASNEFIGAVKANGALDGTTNNLGDVTLTVNVSAAGSMFACYTSSNPLYESAYMGRNWIVSSTGFPSSAAFTTAASIRLPYSTAELTGLNTKATATTGNPNDNGASAANMMLTKISGGTPINFNPTDNCGNGSISKILQLANNTFYANYPYSASGANLGSYNDFNVGSFSEMYLHKQLGTGSALPVELKNFSLNCTSEDEVYLHWSTASEQNSQKFIIERSRDLAQWNYVSEVAAAGNSSQLLNYTSIDTDPFGGTSYYRLVQVDNDGVEKIYGPISVSCANQDNSMIVFPNPTQGSFTVEISSSESYLNAEIQVFDITGKLISMRKVNIVEGKSQILFESSTLQMGTYIVKLISGNQFTPVKVVVN